MTSKKMQLILPLTMTNSLTQRQNQLMLLMPYARPIYTKLVDAANLTAEEMKQYSLHSDAAGEFLFESYQGK